MASRVIRYNALVRILRDPGRRVYVKFEKFGRRRWINNYGEIPRYINSADGDPWDVIVPGYPMLETNKSFRLKELLGVYRLPNGNHKLIVDIYDNLFVQDKSCIRAEVENYKRKYEAHTGLRGSVVYFQGAC